MLYLIIIAKYNFSCFFSNRLNPRSIPGLRIKKKQNSMQFHRYIDINQCCKKTDLSNTRYSCHQVMSWITVFVIFLNVVGIPLNAIVIVIVKRTTSMQSTTNILLCNIALADIFVVVWHLSWFTGDPSGNPEIFNKIICKITRDEIFSVVQALTFTLIAFERYMALFKPMSTRFRINRDHIWKVIAGLWFSTTLLFYLPHVIFKRVCYVNSRPVCCFSFGKTSEAVYFGVLEFVFVVNVLITSFSYLSIVKGMCWDNTICSETVQTKQEADEKRRIVAFLLLLTFIFTLSFIPYIVLKTFTYHFPDIDIKQKQFLGFPVLIFPVVNPSLYILFNSNYRAGFKKQFRDMKTLTRQTWERIRC